MATYVPLLLLFAFAGLITVGLFAATSLLGPKNPTAEKDIPYECGSESTGGAAVRVASAASDAGGSTTSPDGWPGARCSAAPEPVVLPAVGTPIVGAT